jgi:hypothetical protein
MERIEQPPGEPAQREGEYYAKTIPASNPNQADLRKVSSRLL